MPGEEQSDRGFVACSVAARVIEKFQGDPAHPPSEVSVTVMVLLLDS
jgi:hypothetical protein